MTAAVATTTAPAEVRARGLPLKATLAALLLLEGVLAFALATGPAPLGVGDVVASAFAKFPLLAIDSPLSDTEEAILWQLRAPRVVLAALVGAMLAAAGAAYQGVFRNPLADPYLLGVAAGGGLGATLAIAYVGRGLSGTAFLPLAAFAGAAAAVAAAYVLGRSAGGRATTATLLLAGVTVAAFMTAVQTFVQQRHAETLREVYSWILGSFGTTSWDEVALAAPYALASTAVLVAHRRVLDTLAVGDDEAAALGLEVRRVRLVIVAAATVGTAAAVAVSGLIGFVGIIVPHTVRLLVSTSYRALLPLSLIAGAAFLVGTDVMARMLLAPAEVPIGVVTAFFGAPFFAVVLRRSRAVA